MATPAPAPTHVDVLIVGAGLSGVGAAVHLTHKCPTKSFAILEGRQAMGGTWDLFRYPGIRSDSDMYTLGYHFKPWEGAKAITDGPSIKAYIEETADEHRIRPHIRFGHLVKRCSWSSGDALWTVEAQVDGKAALFTARYLIMASGYYSYDEGHQPDFPGAKAFKGKLVHPQFWPEDLDYGGKKVVVIGSGATAVTLVPEMAKTAAKVTMLQRSPTYVVSRPAQDAMARKLAKILPKTLAYQLVRWRNVLLSMYFFRRARKQPERVKRYLIGLVRGHLGESYDVERHFTPRYNPWDQRMCLVPDADLFEAISQGRADVVTDQIATFDATGIKLQSGQHLDADVIVAATGLKLELLSGVDFIIDGAPAEAGKSLVYKGMMLSGFPNMCHVFGYTNASWTLKADLVADYFCRLINHMDRLGYRAVTPRREEGVAEQPFLDFTSGYVTRAADRLPKQGDRKPWRLNQNYALDMAALRFGKIEDGVLEFTSPVPKSTGEGDRSPSTA